MKQKISTLLIILILATVALYLNWDEVDFENPAGVPAGQTIGSGSAPGSAGGDGGESDSESESPLACASYREHRQNVNLTAEIPVLKDKKNAIKVKVTNVIDGDTLRVDKAGQDVRVRLMAMDTPERSTTRNGQIEHFGEEASAYAERLVAESGWEVYLTYDKTEKDQYGRDLAYVWLQDGRMLNAVMVADGYAYSYTSSPKPEYVDLFLVLMREAREQGRGLWGVCS